MAKSLLEIDLIEVKVAKEKELGRGSRAPLKELETLQKELNLLHLNFNKFQGPFKA